MNLIKLNAIFRSSKSILIVCELIHKEEGNLESLGILREIRNEAFIIICQVMNEILGALFPQLYKKLYALQKKKRKKN